MTRLWSLWVDYCDRIPYPPSQRRFASDIGMSPTAFGNWQQAISKLPDRMNLARFARQIGMPYERVLDAALRDSGYLPEPTEEGGGAHAGGAAPKTPPGSGPGRPPLLAVASGDEGNEKLAREATEQARRARAEQMDAIAEMKRKKKDREQ